MGYKRSLQNNDKHGKCERELILQNISPCKKQGPEERMQTGASFKINQKSWNKIKDCWSPCQRIFCIQKISQVERGPGEIAGREIH